MAGKGNIAPMFDGDESYNYWHSARRLLDYTHIKKFVALGGTQVVKNYDELIAAINQSINPDLIDFNKRDHAKRNEFGTTDSPSTRKCINAINEIISQANCVY